MKDNSLHNVTQKGLLWGWLVLFNPFYKSENLEKNWDERCANKKEGARQHWLHGSVCSASQGGSRPSARRSSELWLCLFHVKCE